MTSRSSIAPPLHASSCLSGTHASVPACTQGSSKRYIAAVYDATSGNHVTVASTARGRLSHARISYSHYITAHAYTGCRQAMHAQTCKASSAAAAAVAMPAPLARAQLHLHSSRWKALWQCLLLAVAAASAAPVLLLLDIGERAVMGWQMLQQHLMLSRPPSERQQQQQKTETAACHMSVRRPMLPVWPPMQSMALAVSPLVLLLLPQCAHSAPATLLGISLVLQAYLNLQFAVWARADISQAVRQPPATAAGAVGSKETLRMPTVGEHPLIQVAAAAHTPTLAFGLAQQVPVTVRLFTAVQLAADIFRVGCVLCMACSVVSAAQTAVGPVLEHVCGLVQTALLLSGVDGCFAAAAVVVKVAAYLLQHLLPYVVGLLSCLNAAAVYTCSCVSRYCTA